jgi:hypothetical protein
MKKALIEEETLKKLYDVAMKKAATKKAKRKWLKSHEESDMHPKNGGEGLFYSPRWAGEDNFEEKVTKKYSARNKNEALGTAKNYVTKRAVKLNVPYEWDVKRNLK